MGSSAYALTVGTLFFPLYFNEFAAHGKAGSSDWALAVLLSTLLVGVIAPVLGAYADQNLRRNRMFVITGWISIIGTALLPLTAFLPISVAIALFVVVHVAFNLATSLYDSYISLYGAQDGDYTRRSGLGWALGYAGGLLCLGLTLTVLGFRVPFSQTDYWLVFAVCAGMYGAFSAYVFARLPSECGAARPSQRALSAVVATLRNWRQQSLFFQLVAASILIVDGMTTALYFMATYASEELRFTIAEITLVFAIIQGVAVPSTWLVSAAAGYVKEVYLVILTCMVWAVLLLLFTGRPSYAGMLGIAFGGGIVVGATPALLRAMLGQLVPAGVRAELFGFAALASRMGAILGPLIYLVVLKTWGMMPAMLSAAPAFILGAGILAALAKKLSGERAV